MDLLEGLNTNQREAVETIGGPLLIIAGPGSGKTRVIAHRIAYLVRQCGVRPYRIAAVTFTNKAAREMRERLHRLLGTEADNLTMATFHALCAMILRREVQNTGLEANFAIYDDDDQITLIKRSMEEINVDPRRFAPRAILSAISNAKSQLIDAEQFAYHRQTYLDEIVHRTYQRYQELLVQGNAVDFDDLLLRTYHLFERQPQVLEKYQNRYVHLMVDEFQDTNVAQYSIARQLTQTHRNICVVGDPDQSIYSWRNADIRNILSFQQDYPEAKVVTLEENYRSTKTILEGAKVLISANRQRVEKDLRTNNDRGTPIVVNEAYNEEEEAQYVLGEVQSLVDGSHHSLRDVAVMYRINAQSRALEEACLRYGIPYQLVGGVKFYHRKEVKDVVAYLRLLVNPQDDVSLLRVINVPPRGIGQRTVDELERWARAIGQPLHSALLLLEEQRAGGGASGGMLSARAAQSLLDFFRMIQGLTEESHRLDPVETMDRVLERTGYKNFVQDGDKGEERWENILELRAASREFTGSEPEEALALFLESVSLVTDMDSFDEARDSITLITLHQAKGLEFPVVFIVGMEEGLLPHSRSIDDPNELEEERRLCYVGMTRAKERLYLVRAFRRGMMGGRIPNAPSRFLTDIPRNLVSSPTALGRRDPSTWSGWTPGVQPEASPKAAAAPPLFKAGDKVRHARFGDGIVVSCVESGQDHEVTVAFKEANGVKRLMLSFAPLEKVG